MYLNQQWRILTVGEGDLSFSYALYQQCHPALLVASVYDSLNALNQKYPTNYHAPLNKAGVQVVTQLDVTQPSSFTPLGAQQFDLVIFQFPLHVGFDSPGAYLATPELADSNLRNRWLLRQFLLNAFAYLLDKKGARLCYISSKDVKPYTDWDLEQALHQGTDIAYFGSMPFAAENFPGYRIRNVGRDKYVKATQATTYVWGKELPNELNGQLTRPNTLPANHCPLCGSGPFSNPNDYHAHQQNRRHQQKQHYQQQWQRWLAQHCEK